MEEQVILVDVHDQEIGTMDKLAAHQNGGHLHRAITVQLFDAAGNWLLQKRADSKYHAPGLWSNTCCTHPRLGESVEVAAVRRLQEEMGMETILKKIGTHLYKADVGNGLTEWEYDHLFTGVMQAEPMLNPEEASAWRLVSQADLEQEIAEQPERFTPWFLQLRLFLTPEYITGKKIIRSVMHENQSYDYTIEKVNEDSVRVVMESINLRQDFLNEDLSSLEGDLLNLLAATSETR